MSKWYSVDVASLYNGVQKYLSLLLFKFIVNDVKILCLTQFDPRKFTFLAFMNFAKRKNTKEKKCDVWKHQYTPSKWRHIQRNWEKKHCVSIVHNHAFLLLLPMKENELPNSHTKKPMECLPSQTLNGANLTLGNTTHFINTLKKYWTLVWGKIEYLLSNMLSNYTT